MMAAMAPMPKPPGQPGVADVKPRLTKEQHDILEAEFQRHHKPSTATKKGFADHLGVPLDKINNWFQNRRAKVKQEAKKAQNAQMMQASLPYHTMHHPVQNVPPIPQSSQQQSVGDFYSMSAGFSMGPASVQAPVSAPAHLSNEHLELQDQLRSFAPPQPDHNSLFLTSISESSQQADKQAVIESMIKAGYGWDPLSTQDMGAFGFGDDAQLNLSLDVSGAGLGHLGEFPPAFPSTFDFGEEIGPTGVSPSNSASSAPSTFSVATTAATAATSNPMGSSTNLAYNWADGQGSTSATPAKQIDNPFDSDLPNFANGNHPASSSQVSLHQQWVPGPNYVHPYQHSNNSSQLQLDQAQLQGFADLEPPMPPFAEGTYSRRSSSTSLLVENLKTVGIQSPASDSPLNANGGFQAPVAPSGLAARRQRHPAPLNQGMRSASYTTGMGSMPSPSTLNHSADHTLRRIRSTGLTNGRIQKPSLSAPRSPLHFSFEQAANSPKFARQLTGYTTAVSTPGLPVSTGSLAPPTPCTPSEGGRFPTWQLGSAPPSHTSVADANSPSENLGVQWPGEPSSDDSKNKSGGSPPRTPLEATQLNQMRQSSAPYRDTPPQSAPATQASFARPMFAPSSVSNVALPQEYLVANSMQNHLRRPSLPVSSMSMDGSTGFHGAPMSTVAGDLQMTFGGMQMGSHMTNNDPFMMLPPENNSMGMSNGQPSASDLFVHHYSPPQGPERKLSMSPRRQQEPVIKSYTFTNTSAHDYKFKAP